MNLADLVKADQNAPPPKDKLDAIREAASRLRDLKLLQADLAARLEEAQKKEHELISKELPELMDTARVPSITIEAEGNMPAFSVEVKAHYSANIAASWPEGRRRAAFDWLQANGHGDLIRTAVSVQFKREDRDEAIKLQRRLIEAGVSPAIKEEVHHGALTAWLREQIEHKGVVPPLDLLGAHVGRIAKIKSKGD